MDLSKLNRSCVFQKNRFDIKKFAYTTYKKFNNTYIVSEIVIKELEQKFDVEIIGGKKLNFQYIINHQNKTAIAPIYFGAELTKCTGDIFKRARLPSAASFAARFFLKKYPEYSLALSLGTLDHEFCVFIRNNNNKFEIVAYDTNSMVASGVLRNFVKKFGLKVRVTGYNHRRYNDDGWCSAYTWSEIYSFMKRSKQLFTHPKYNHLHYCKRAGRLV